MVFEIFGLKYGDTCVPTYSIGEPLGKVEGGVAIRPHDFVNFSKSEAAVNPDIP